MFQYQQQPRGLKISGVDVDITGSTGIDNSVVSFSAAAFAAITNLGTWPIATWCTVTISATAGTSFTFTREGLYEVEYAIPISPAAEPGALAMMSGISFVPPAAQLVTRPQPANPGIFQSSSFTRVSSELWTLRGTAKIPVRKTNLTSVAVAGTSPATMRLHLSNAGSDTRPGPGTVTLAQVTLWIKQVNHLWG